MASLGNTVANVSRVVPHGLLVFFPSFPLMEKTLEFWRANGHADRIENVKPMFVEPKGKGTFNEVIDGYYSKVNDPASKGGSFFAVCRGKASEGLDFADTFGRGVVITGLPFPPKLDPRVVLKMQFLDEMCRRRAPGTKFLSGQDWYRQQAFRAVNQAIGRVIRHKEDYGAIFLCDQRFKNSDALANLPFWVRPYVRLHQTFGNMVRDVSQFFRVAQKLRPVAVKTPATEPPAANSLSDASSSSSFSSAAGSCYAPKAKVLDAHLPSLKRRRVDENSGASGMARICIEYESEAKESQRRPASLLDALDRGDHCNRDRADEETGRLSTLSLQYEKRMEDELRGGKRKIKLVQEPKLSVSEDVSEEGKTSRARQHLADMKKSLSKENFDRIIVALQTYKKTDRLEDLLAETSVLSEDWNTHSLLRGFYQFVRAHHKKMFDEKCQELTGLGCGYKPEHSLSKEEKKAMMLQSGAENQLSAGLSSTCGQLDTQQLNKGGPHLSQQGLKEVQPGPAQKSQVHAAFLADVKKALGTERSARLFQAVSSYKATDRYEDLVSTVVSLFTERDENFGLLIRFGTFVRPHHKKQYQEMLDALIGQPSSAEEPVLNKEREEGEVSPSPPSKSQSKISSFFFRSQRK